jgi:DNA ligase (NAD+)
LKHFVARDAFDIEGLGAKHIAAFWEDGLIKTPGDIFRLEAAQLEGREGWGKTSVAKLVAAIESRRRIPLERFINALGIPQVGEVTAKLLARHYRSFAAWRQAMETAADPESDEWRALTDVHGIGEDMATDIVGFFAEARNRAILDDLAGLLEIADYEGRQRSAAASPLAGKTIVFTGALETMGRSEAKARAEALGANVTSSVSAKTDYVVVGADAGSKAEKAAKLGVATLSEAEFLALAGNGGA